jgi:hypothetical protein
MNAKMIITVPIENIPNEVNRIIEDLATRMQELVEKTKNCVYNENHTLVIEEIDDIRKKLSLIDLNYEDCYSVLLGYVKYHNDKRISEKQEESENTSEEPSNE